MDILYKTCYNPCANKCLYNNCGLSLRKEVEKWHQ